MIFISSIHLNWDHYDPKLPPFHFLDSVSLYSLHFKKKKKILSLSICTHSRVQFPLHWLAYLYSTLQFLLQSDTYIQKQSPLQNWGTCISLQFLLRSSITCILASSFIITHIHFLLQGEQYLLNKKRLQDSSSDRVCNQRKVIIFFFHILHFVVLQFFPPLLLRLFSPPFVFLFLYSPVPLSILPWTLATKFVPRRSLRPPCQQVSLMPLQFSRCPFSCRSTHSGRLTFSKSLPSTLHLSVVSLFSHFVRGHPRERPRLQVSSYLKS